jgi:sugar lactone lactonase YvrE
MSAVRPVNAVRCLLGEGPIWSPADSALFWIDIEEQHLYRLDDGAGEPRRWDLPAKPGCLALRAGGGLIIALQTGVHAFDLTTGALTPLVTPEHDQPGNRLNDGSADARGRLWVGSMDDAEQADTGTLYRIDPDRTVTGMRTGLGVSNGIGWSPDGGTMYHTDSTARTITAYDFDPDTGDIGNPRPFAVDDGCHPDGLTVDAEGYVWSAKWDGWRVVRYAPDGTIDRVQPLSVQRPTSVAFGGPRLDRLYISTARSRLAPSAVAASPDAGALLIIDEPGTTGRPEPLCAL